MPASCISNELPLRYTTAMETMRITNHEAAGDIRSTELLEQPQAPDDSVRSIVNAAILTLTNSFTALLALPESPPK